MKVSLKLAMKFSYPLNTIEGIRIMVILATEYPLMPNVRLDLLFSGTIKILKICRTYNLKIH